MNEASALPRSIAAALARLGLLRPGARCRAEPLGGGVSCDVWRVELEDRTVCVKRALARLRVAEEWLAPVERNATEVAWFELAARILPRAVPAVLAHDPAGGVFVMEYLDPASHRLWKQMLRAGPVRAEQGAQVARALVRLHAATAGDGRIAQRFATDAAFHALRLDAYLLASARRHPDRAAALQALVRACMTHRLALVHGDVSPKNILFGPHGPVFLDAETAWYGDPAFDVAFCLNHLLLKCLWNPAEQTQLLDCFRQFVAAYREGVDWEPVDGFERRAAALLPGLMLARVDGKSPVEYLDTAGQRLVRSVARELLAAPVAELQSVAGRWRGALESAAARAGGSA